MLTITELKKEAGNLNYGLDGMNKYMCMLNYGTDNLDVLLSMCKRVKNMKRIGYTGESSNQKPY